MELLRWLFDVGLGCRDEHHVVELDDVSASFLVDVDIAHEVVVLVLAGGVEFLVLALDVVELDLEFVGFADGVQGAYHKLVQMVIK